MKKNRFMDYLYPITMVMLMSFVASNQAQNLPGQRKGDTIETLANPMALRKELKRLKAMPHWTKFATPAEAKLFDGKETVWPVVPHSDYDPAGIDRTMLGGKVPPAGVHPRLLFNEEDIPTFYNRIKTTVSGQKLIWNSRELLRQTLFDPNSSDGKIYRKLATGDLKGLEWPKSEFATENQLPRFTYLFKGHTPRWKKSPHHNYYSFIMNMALMLAYFDKDEAKGRELATAVSNYWILREQVINDYIRNAARWRLEPPDVFNGLREAAGGDSGLAFNYDLAAKWMSEEQKRVLRRIIAKLVNGRRPCMLNAPARWAMHNWSSWQVSEYTNLLLSIQGEKGYDPTPLKSLVSYMETYLTYGIDKYGSVFESNGKVNLGHTISTIAVLARHHIGPDFLGHPHLRTLSAAQAQWVMPQNVSPKAVVANSGTHCNGILRDPSYFKTFYPKDKCADWLLRQANPNQDSFDFEAYKKESVGKVLSMNFRTNFIRPYDFFFRCVDWEGFKDTKGRLLALQDRSPLSLPHEFIDPIRGYMMVRSDDSPGATFLHFEARSDLLYAGHNFNNGGMFQLSALGKVWALIPHAKAWDANHNSLPRIDGLGYETVPGNTRAPRVSFRPVVNNATLVLGQADLSNAWDHVWGLQPYTPYNYRAVKDRTIRLETNPEVVRLFKGTQHYKGRFRNSSTNYYVQDWSPTFRIITRPVQYAFRKAGLVKGDHPYVVITDDLKMDGKKRQYEWVMQVPEAVRIVDKPNPGEVILSSDDTPIEAGTPLLLVKYLDDAGPEVLKQVSLSLAKEKVSRRDTSIKSINVLKIGKRDTQMNSRVLLIPYRHGQAAPKVVTDPKTGSVVLRWSGSTQQDQLDFSMHKNTTELKLQRLKK